MITIRTRAVDSAIHSGTRSKIARGNSIVCPNPIEHGIQERNQNADDVRVRLRDAGSER